MSRVQKNPGIITASTGPASRTRKHSAMLNRESDIRYPNPTNRLASRMQKMETAMLLFSAPKSEVIRPMNRMAKTTISAERVIMAIRSRRRSSLSSVCPIILRIIDGSSWIS